jgi:hypothetical protein
MNEAKEPPIIYIRKSDRQDFERLLEKDSPFAGKGNKLVFLMAMVYGFINKVKRELTDRDPSGWIRTEYLSDREKSLIEAIAVYDTGSLDVLLDRKRVFSIAEEYAAGGIKLLKDEVFSAQGGSFSKRLESQLLLSLEKLKLKS